MKNYSILILCVIVFAVGYAIGARTFNPAVMVDHVYPQQDFVECQQKGGSLTIIDGSESCVKTINIFGHPTNSEYMKFMDDKPVNN